MMVDLYSYKSFSNTFFGYYHKRQFQKVFWKKNILKRYSYTTAPTSKSKTKNYRLLTGAQCAPHIVAAAYFKKLMLHHSLWARAQPSRVALRPRLRVYNS